MPETLKTKFSETDVNERFENILQQAMMMNGTKAGTLQMVNSKDNSLDLIVSYGLSEEFVTHFKKVTLNDGSVCSRAMEAGKTIFIEDLTKDELFVKHLYLAIQNNIVAIQSTPLICRNGRLIGMVSTHFKTPKKLSKETLAKFESFCSSAAEKIKELYVDQAPI
jgi:GAF domain-containing protein